MNKFKLEKIRNLLFDWIGHVLILGNITGYWIGYKTAIIQYQGDKIFFAFLVIAIVFGYGVGWIFENAQEFSKISKYNEWDVIRTTIGFVGGFVTSFYYRDSELLHWYNWIFGITTILYIGWCWYSKKKQTKK